MLELLLLLMLLPLRRLAVLPRSFSGRGFVPAAACVPAGIEESFEF